ncbi:MAG: succinyl-CoA synthetase subunit beta [Gammaproteobacteria bacterium SG8_11]|nr:MAG: succinyl-CoA synthetase subunit beta [Gammaproteobacteria bacterium SG8_11]
MNLHEYQAKNLFKQYGIAVPESQLVSNVEQAREAASVLGGDGWVVKAQVHSGGRGKAGGVKRVHGFEQLESVVQQLIGANLVTQQTGEKGLPIHSLLIEALSPFEQELYLGALIDRGSNKVVIMASPAGGMDIEEVAKTQPEKIFTVAVDPVVGLMPYQCRQIGFAMQLSQASINNLTKVMMSLYRLFVDKDLSLIEINPLVINADGEFLALDAKINIDDNALYRQQALAQWRDASQEDEREHHAHQLNLNYVTLNGDIGCMVNGAGLAMATMDIIKLHGGEPANFLDVGGGITADRVGEAFKLVVSDASVKAILVNIFGGIVRCDLIAEGIIQAMREVSLSIPVVVRLQGTNVEQGLQLLQASGLSVTTAEDLTDAAIKVVKAAKDAADAE